MDSVYQRKGKSKSDRREQKKKGPREEMLDGEYEWTRVIRDYICVTFFG